MYASEDTMLLNEEGVDRSVKIFRLSRQTVLLMCVIGVLMILAAGPIADASATKPIKVGLVLSVSGRGDNAFNDMAWSGAEMARKELGITFQYSEPGAELSAVEQTLATYARLKYDLIISIGFGHQDVVNKVAKAFPDQKFAIVDAEVELPNVASLVFKEHEGSFLVGALAAMKTETKKIGFVGGVDSPLIRKFHLGYEQGAKYIEPGIVVLSSYVGSFRDPLQGKELALAQYDKGADIVYQAAGSSGMGVIDAAKDRKLLAIGVDSNQNWIVPGNVLSSMLKRVDLAVFDTIKNVVDEQFSAGIHVFGLAEGGVDYALDEYNKDLITDDMISELKVIKEKIVKGEIQVKSE